jgi:hypothetical protein
VYGVKFVKCKKVFLKIRLQTIEFQHVSQVVLFEATGNSSKNADYAF